MYIQCPDCGKPFKVREELRHGENSTRCPHCGEYAKITMIVKPMAEE